MLTEKTLDDIGQKIVLTNVDKKKTLVDINQKIVLIDDDLKNH